MHVLSFLKGEFDQLSVNARTDCHSIEGLNRPQAIQIERKILLLYRANGRRDRSTTRSAFASFPGLAALRLLPTQSEKADGRQHDQNNQHCFPRESVFSVVWW